MQIPVPDNTLVAFTLVGALLTAVVAGALAAPVGLGHPSGQEDTTAADTNVSERLDADAPAPNQDFTPSVRTQPEYEEHEEYGEDEDGEEHDDYEDDDEYGGDDYEDDER